MEKKLWLKFHKNFQKLFEIYKIVDILKRFFPSWEYIQ